jgi:hypothetical protein
MLHRSRCGRQHTLTRIEPKGHLVPKQAICIRTGTAELGLLASTRWKLRSWLRYQATVVAMTAATTVPAGPWQARPYSWVRR